MIKWNVFYFSPNRKKIEQVDVIEWRFNEMKDVYDQCYTKEVFSEELRKLMMYRFWRKYEYEITVKSYDFIHDGSDELRVDIFDQLAMNWDAFVDCVWNVFKETEDAE